MLPPGRAWRIAAVVGGGLAVVASAGAFAVGPVVRARVAKEAERRHLEIEVGRVRPGFLSVLLEDVKVRPAGIPGVALELGEVRAELSPSLALREVRAHGGRVAIEGEPEKVLERVDEYRHRASPAGGGASTAGRAPASVDGLTVVWSTPSGASISCAGVRLSRGDEGVRVGADSVVARREGVAFELKGLAVEIEPGGAPRRIAATTLDVTVAPDPASAAKVAPAPRAPTAEPAPPPLPPVTARKPGKGGKAHAAKAIEARAPAPEEPAPPSRPVLPVPDLHAIRGRIALVAAEVERRVPDGLRVEVGGLSVHLDSAGEPLAFGPGPFSLERRGGAVHVVFTSSEREPRAPAAPAAPGTPGTPLSVDLELPLGAGDVVARLAGGPVSLAMLGVREGMRGLTDVARGTVSGRASSLSPPTGAGSPSTARWRSAGSRGTSRASRPSRCGTSPSRRPAAACSRAAASSASTRRSSTWGLCT